MSNRTSKFKESVIAAANNLKKASPDTNSTTDSFKNSIGHKSSLPKFPALRLASREGSSESVPSFLAIKGKRIVLPNEVKLNHKRETSNFPLRLRSFLVPSGQEDNQDSLPKIDSVFNDQKRIAHFTNEIFKAQSHKLPRSRFAVYLNSYATTQMNSAVEAAIKHLTTQLGQPGYLGTTTRAARYTQSLDLVSKKKLLQALALKSQDYSILPRGAGAGDALSHVADIIERWANQPSKAKSKVVVFTTDQEHATNNDFFANKGFELVKLPIDKITGNIDLKTFKQAIETYKEQGYYLTASFPLASNITGRTIHNLKEILETSKQSGVLTGLDAAAGAAHLPLQDYVSNCDWIAIPAHKSHGPGGCGLLVVNHNALPKQTHYPMGLSGNICSESVHSLLRSALAVYWTQKSITSIHAKEEQSKRVLQEKIDLINRKSAFPYRIKIIDDHDQKIHRDSHGPVFSFYLERKSDGRVVNDAKLVAMLDILGISASYGHNRANNYAGLAFGQQAWTRLNVPLNADDLRYLCRRLESIISSYDTLEKYMVEKTMPDGSPYWTYQDPRR